MSAVEWCDPPERVGSWRDLLTEVATRPGTWALTRVYDTRGSAQSMTRQLRRSVEGNGNLSVPRGPYEFKCTRTADQTGFGVWARWMGEPSWVEDVRLGRAREEGAPEG